MDPLIPLTPQHIPILKSATYLLVVVSSLSLVDSQQLVQPEQVHLSYSDVPQRMVVSWVTGNYTAPSVVEYGTQTLSEKSSVPGPTKFVDGGPERRTIWIHTVVTDNLRPGQKYVYHVGGPSGWSDLFTFTAMRSGSSWSPRFVIYGDLGNKNAQSLTDIQEEAQKGHFDALLHIGDFAYDMNDKNGRVGDEFMRQIEPIAAYVPYMTCPGNHEQAYNFSHYKKRFSMPGGDPGNMVYSFDIGPVHVVSISTEAFYTNEFQGMSNIIGQYEWLLNDLESANRPEARAKRPWILVIGHRPMYCSNQDDLCTGKFNPVRDGPYPGSRTYSLEDLFYKYGVDIQFYAHEHSYERLWPVYKGQVCNGSRSAYHNPGAPVHIVTGSAGCQEIHTPFEPVVRPWSAAHRRDYGYTRLQVVNATHLYLEQVSSDKGGAVIDKMTLIKERHGPGSFNCRDYRHL